MKITQMQGSFLKGVFHGIGTLRLKQHQILYTNCAFLSGQPDPLPLRLDADYPKTVDKKKGEVPPEVPIGCPCPDDFSITVSVQGRCSQAPGRDGNSHRREDESDAAQQTCTHEDHRLVRVHVHVGWPGEDGALGAQIDCPCLGVQQSLQPAGDWCVAASAQDGARGQETGWVLVPVAEIECTHGVGAFKSFQLGMAGEDGAPSLQPGQYTLVFSSFGVEDAVVCVTGAPGTSGKK